MLLWEFWKKHLQQSTSLIKLLLYYFVKFRKICILLRNTLSVPVLYICLTLEALLPLFTMQQSVPSYLLVIDNLKSGRHNTQISNKRTMLLCPGEHKDHLVQPIFAYYSNKKQKKFLTKRERNRFFVFCCVFWIVFAHNLIVIRFRSRWLRVREKVKGTKIQIIWSVERWGVMKNKVWKSFRRGY